MSISCMPFSGLWFLLLCSAGTAWILQHNVFCFDSYSSFIYKFVFLNYCLHFVCYGSMQWPGAYCDTRQSCCYPKTGKPAADFSIHGLWPNYNDGSWPSNCDPDSVFDKSQVLDTKFECYNWMFNFHVFNWMWNLFSWLNFLTNSNWFVNYDMIEYLWTKKSLIVYILMQISELISSMEKEWPSLSCPSSNGMRFWSHEWEKHGTCAQSELDQTEYFEATLKLKKKLNLLKILKNAGTSFSFLFYIL